MPVPAPCATSRRARLALAAASGIGLLFSASASLAVPAAEFIEYAHVQNCARGTLEGIDAFPAFPGTWHLDGSGASGGAACQTISSVATVGSYSGATPQIDIQLHGSGSTNENASGVGPLAFGEALISYSVAVKGPATGLPVPVHVTASVDATGTANKITNLGAEPVPEPASGALLAFALVAIGIARARQKRLRAY